MQNINWNLFLKALGLAFVFEGVLWALCTESMRKTMERAVLMSSASLKLVGLIGVAMGLLLCFLGK